MNDFTIVNKNGNYLKRMRIVRGIKQAHLAELLGVSQATVSKLENSTLAPSDKLIQRYNCVFSARLDSRADMWLKRLVESSTNSVHLMCETSHYLLAASPSRKREWQRTIDEIRSGPLSRDLPEDIALAELDYIKKNKESQSPLSYCVKTKGRNSGPYNIEPATMLWERFQISGGEWVRLITNIDNDALRTDI